MTANTRVRRTTVTAMTTGVAVGGTRAPRHPSHLAVQSRARRRSRRRRGRMRLWLSLLSSRRLQRQRRVPPQQRAENRRLGRHLLVQRRRPRRLHRQWRRVRHRRQRPRGLQLQPLRGGQQLRLFGRLRQRRPPRRRHRLRLWRSWLLKHALRQRRTLMERRPSRGRKQTQRRSCWRTCCCERTLAVAGARREAPQPRRAKRVARRAGRRCVGGVCGWIRFPFFLSVHACTQKDSSRPPVFAAFGFFVYFSAILPRAFWQ